MDRAIRCECGFEARADDETDLAAHVQCHALEAHGMALSSEEARIVALGGMRREPAEQGGEGEAR